jgi:hypothetical protein
VSDEYEQRYDASRKEPLAIWLFCRLCRTRIQLRTVPRKELPFRCFCGYAGTLSAFDVFEDEDEVRKFAKTFEDLYQTTKALMKEAEMPLPATRFYSTEDAKRIVSGERAAAAEPSLSDSSERPAAPTEDEASYRRTSRTLADAVVDAPDLLARHDALTKLSGFLFARRARYPDAKRLCHQACTADVQSARDVVAEAGVRHRRGERVKLTFPSFRQLVTLYEEENLFDRALEVASRAAALGLPKFDESIARLRAKLAR